MDTPAPTSSCPTCEEHGRPLLFGKPGPSLLAAAQRGDVALGGCARPRERVNRRCANGHVWLDADGDGWAAELLGATGSAA